MQHSVKYLIGLFLFLFPSYLLAEYRAFVLQITGPNGEVLRTFTHNLDPDQYRGYYPLEAGQTITYIDTWMCKGSTGNFEKICDKPAPPTPAEPDQKAATPANVKNLDKKISPAQNEAVPTGRQALQ